MMSNVTSLGVVNARVSRVTSLIFAQRPVVAFNCDPSLGCSSYATCIFTCLRCSCFDDVFACRFCTFFVSISVFIRTVLVNLQVTLVVIRSY